MTGRTCGRICAGHPRAARIRRAVPGGLHRSASRTPAEAGGFGRGYTPELEIAARLVGLEGVPVMGFGKLDWLARRVGRTGSELVKPSPVHAMAAIGAARSGLEVESIKAALAVERGDQLRYPLTACAGEEVHVFEDSPSSLRGIEQAVQHLNRLGLGLSSPATASRRSARPNEPRWLRRRIACTRMSMRAYLFGMF